MMSKLLIRFSHNVKIVNFPSAEQFYIKDCQIANTSCKLVFPRTMNIIWNDENKIFRSSVWTDDGYLISASFKKFTNLEEQPEFEPLNYTQDIEFVHKLDGSTCIISKFKNKLIVRTRGTIDASILKNGNEIELLKVKYPNVFDNNILDTEEHSIICEWYSPNNIIVQKEADEPTLWLTGIVRHEDYSYFTQHELDKISVDLKIQRPKRYSFNTIKEMVDVVREWQSGEGVVVCGNDGQVLKKVKSLRYLYLHRIKSQLSSEKNLIEFYIDEGMPEYQSFFKLVETTFDWELAQQFNSEITKLAKAGKKAKAIIENLNRFVQTLKIYPTRKEQAKAILEGPDAKRASILFNLLDNKQPTKEQFTNLVTEQLTNGRE